MAKIAWTNNQGGVWTDAADWSGGAVPGTGDDVVISVAPAVGEYYDVNLFDLNLAVHSLTLDQADATLVVGNSQLATDLFLDAGTLNLEDGSLSGTIVANGRILEAGGTLAGDTSGPKYSPLPSRGGQWSG